MNNKLFVGNLSFSTGEAELRQAFEPFGALRSAVIITDRMTGRPRGFGFVEYETESDAQKAIDALNGQELDGRSLNVNVARERQGGGGGGGGGGGPRRGGGGGGGGMDRRGGGGRGGGGRGNRGDRGDSSRW